MEMTFSQLKNSLSEKKYHPLYFLYGEESYFIDQIGDILEQEVLSEGEKAFNLSVLYGKDVDAKTLIDLASRYPMMAPLQVVILKEAQDMRSFKDLQRYIENPVPTTILTIQYKHKKLDKRTSFAKALFKQAHTLHSKRLYENQIPEWIEKYLKRKQFDIAPAASALIAEYLGTDLSKVANELDKMAINLPLGTKINTGHVESLIGVSKDYNVFELQKALGKRDRLKVFEIARYFAANPKKNPFVMVVGSLYNYFSKVYQLHFLLHESEKKKMASLRLHSAFFLREYEFTARQYKRQQVEHIIGLLKEYDLRSKGVDSVSVSEGDLLRELLVKILA